MQSPIKVVKEFLDSNVQLPAKFLIEVSGDACSMLLLTTMEELSGKNDSSITVAHSTFGATQSVTDSRTTFVKDYCANHNVPVITEDGDASRSNFLEKARIDSNSDYIVTAENADDNLESVLITLTYGDDIEDLKGIPAVEGKVIRPLMKLDGDEIATYVEETGISYIPDSYDDDDFSRDFIRSKAIPALKKINSKASVHSTELSKIMGNHLEAHKFIKESFGVPVENKDGRAIVNLNDLKSRDDAHMIYAMWEMAVSLIGNAKELSNECIAAIYDNAPLFVFDGVTVHLPTNLKVKNQGDRLIMETVSA